MEVLVVSMSPTHPQDAGNRQRINSLLARIQAFGHRVHFCFIQREAVNEAALAAMRAAWDELTFLPYDRRLERPSRGEAFGTDDWFPDSLTAEMASLAARTSPDVVIAEYIFASRAFEAFPKAFKILDTHDVFTDRQKRLEVLGLPPAFFFTDAAGEKRALDRADLVLAIQPGEAEFLQNLSTRVVTILGHWPAAAPMPARPPGPPVIGYLGSGNPLNQRALARFLAALDPAAMAAFGARLRVGGGATRGLRNPPDFLEAAGPVGPVAAFYAECDLIINPHEGGTGLKIKTVEGLAHGRPVLGTREAFAGIATSHVGQAATDAPALAGLLARWLTEPDFRAGLAEASQSAATSYQREVERQCAIFRSPASLRTAARRPRLLLVTDIPFWRQMLGNQVRIAELIRAARSAWDVDVLVLRDLALAERPALQAILGGRGRLFVATPTRGGEEAPPAWIEASPELAGFERESFNCAHFAALEAHLARQNYDLCILEYIRLSYLRHARMMPKLAVLDLHDIMSLRVENFARFGRMHFLQISAAEEFRILGHFPVLLAIQPAEFVHLERRLPGRALHAPHVMRIPPVVERRRPARRVIFLGGNSPMNRDGLRWFLTQVWPCFEGFPASLHVAGEICRSLPEGAARVVPEGPLQDPAGFFEAADVAINPIFHGGGLKIKSVEYLCHGIPAVLTREAAFGLPGGAGQAFLLAEDRGAFIRHLHALLTDDALRLRMGAAAREFGRAAFAPERLATPLAMLAAYVRPPLTPREIAHAGS